MKTPDWNIAPTPPTPTDIIKAVAAAAGIDFEVMTGPDRTKEVARARDVACLIMRDMLGMTFADIAESFGRDVSTAQIAIKRVRSRLADDEPTAFLARSANSRLTNTNPLSALPPMPIS